ncbi:hypothetical protein PoB_000278500 [Plakobranchus ocellatus]|uniref:Uncharacterized protein n=1 Tax=Plakobranchus ocellatus TaxID=259542 RepID=A0AAV3XZM4_9GAST|nr:hypothetical protein PoB_000278500 [Plakobranchus ocellatus]
MINATRLAVTQRSRVAEVKPDVRSPTPMPLNGHAEQSTDHNSGYNLRFFWTLVLTVDLGSALMVELFSYLVNQYAWPHDQGLNLAAFIGNTLSTPSS